MCGEPCCLLALSMLAGDRSDLSSMCALPDVRQERLECPRRGGRLGRPRGVGEITGEACGCAAQRFGLACNVGNRSAPPLGASRLDQRSPALCKQSYCATSRRAEAHRPRPPKRARRIFLCNAARARTSSVAVPGLHPRRPSGRFCNSALRWRSGPCLGGLALGRVPGSGLDETDVPDAGPSSSRGVSLDAPLKTSPTPTKLPPRGAWRRRKPWAAGAGGIATPQGFKRRSNTRRRPQPTESPQPKVCPRSAKLRGSPKPAEPMRSPQVPWGRKGAATQGGRRGTRESPHPVGPAARHMASPSS